MMEKLDLEGTSLEKAGINNMEQNSPTSITSYGTAYAPDLSVELKHFICEVILALGC